MFWMRHKLPTPLEGFRHRTDLLDQGVDQNHLFFLVFRSDGCFCFVFVLLFFVLIRRMSLKCRFNFRSAEGKEGRERYIET